MPFLQIMANKMPFAIPLLLTTPSTIKRKLKYPLHHVTVVVIALFRRGRIKND